MKFIPTSFWRMQAAAITALRWDWNAGTLINDTGTGADTWVDQDLTDGQVNNLAINWDYTPISPSSEPTLLLGDWLVGHPRAFQGSTFMLGSFVTPVGIKNVEAWMEFRITGLPSGGFDALIQLYSIECFDEQAAEVMLHITDAGICTVWVRLDSGTVQIYGLPVPVNHGVLVKVGLRIEASGLNTNFTVFIDNISEDTFSVVTSTIGTGIREQIQGRAGIFMEDASSTYAAALSLFLYRYKLFTL